MNAKTLKPNFSDLRSRLIKGSFNKFSTRLLFILSLLFTSSIMGLNAQAATLVVDDNASCPGATFTDIQSAVTAANPNDTIQVCSGTYPLSATITLNKAGLTLIGTGTTRPVVQIPASTGNGFHIFATNITLDNFEIQKTDLLGAPHELILVQGNNFTAQNNLIYGPDPGSPWSANGLVSRAFVVTGSLTGLLFNNNTIRTLRQPAYINGGSPRTTGTISNNNVSGTRGWVVDGATINFTGNTFGPPANQGADIALLSSCDPADYPNLSTLSANNGNALISAQFGNSTSNPSNLQGWLGVSQRTASGTFVVGPATPPNGVGSYRMATGAGNSGPNLPQGGAGQGGKTWFGTQQYDNTLLSSITNLKYSTYITARAPSTSVAPVLVLQIDTNNDGTRDNVINFEPVYSAATQGATVQGAWQTWDALNGRWYLRNPVGGLCAGAADPCLYTLPQIAAAIPTAKIVNWYGTSTAFPDGRGTQFVAGQNDPGSPWNDFDGNIDNFIIGINNANSVTDFEPTRPTVTINQASGQADPTSSSPINFTVTFSEPVTGFDASDVILGGTAGATIKNVTGTGPTYNVAVSGMTGSGTVTATVVNAAATSNSNSAPSTASTSSDNSVTYFTCNNITLPAVTSVPRNAQFTIPITVDSVSGRGILSYTFRLNYNSSVVTPISVDNAGTLSSAMSITINSTPGALLVTASGTAPLSGSGTLLNIRFLATSSIGTNSNLSFGSFEFNEGVPCVNTGTGVINIVSGIISGTITYTNAGGPPAGPPLPVPVPNATLSATGPGGNVSTTTTTNGTYSLGGLGAGAYTVTPSKTGNVNGITGFDSARISQHVVNLITLNSTQLLAADVSGNGTVTAFDAALISQYVVNIPNSSSTGTWRFFPANRSYSNVETDQTNQDYGAILMGDVSGNWNPAAPNQRAVFEMLEKDSDLMKTNAVINVNAPANQTVSPGAITIPISVGDTTGQGIISYQFDLTFNQNVITPQAVPCEVAGTISSSLSVTCNRATPGLLEVTVSGSMPISGTGTLLNLKFNAVGNSGTSSQLTFSDFMFNEGVPQGVANNGQITVSVTTAATSSISGTITDAAGTRLPSALVTLTNSAGETTTTLANPKGKFIFRELPVGEVYIITIRAKHYSFTPQVVNLVNNLQELIFTADPREAEQQ